MNNPNSHRTHRALVPEFRFKNTEPGHWRRTWFHPGQALFFLDLLRCQGVRQVFVGKKEDNVVLHLWVIDDIVQLLVKLQWVHSLEISDLWSSCSLAVALSPQLQNVIQVACHRKLAAQMGGTCQSQEPRAMWGPVCSSSPEFSCRCDSHDRGSHHGKQVYCVFSWHPAATFLRLRVYFYFCLLPSFLCSAQICFADLVFLIPIYSTFFK